MISARAEQEPSHFVGLLALRLSSAARRPHWPLPSFVVFANFASFKACALLGYVSSSWFTSFLPPPLLLSPSFEFLPPSSSSSSESFQNRHRGSTAYLWYTQTRKPDFLESVAKQIRASSAPSVSSSPSSSHPWGVLRTTRVIRYRETE